MASGFPIVYHTSCSAGATHTLQFVYYSDDAGTTPVDLSAYTAVMKVRENAEDTSTPLVSLTDPIVGLEGISLAADGTITVQIARDTTASFAAGVYAYDLKITTGSTTIRFAEGAFTVSPEVSHS